MMFRLYLQLFLVVGGFLSFLGSIIWLVLTYIYAYHIIPERGKTVEINWFLISGVCLFGLLSLAGFIYGVVLVKRSKNASKELMERYNKLT